MSAILAIGPHKFALESVAVASAIADALRAAPQVTVSGWHQKPDRVRFRPADDAEQILIFRARLVDKAQIETPIPPTLPNVQAVLGEPPVSRKRTHKILADRNRELAAAGK